MTAGHKQPSNETNSVSCFKPDHSMYPVHFSSALGSNGSTAIYHGSITVHPCPCDCLLHCPGSQSGSLDPNLLIIDVEPKSPHTTLECENALYAELEKATTVPVTPAELQKIKNRIESDFIWSLYSNLGLANQLAEYEARAGDWRYLQSIRDRLAKVTPEDIMRVAKQTFTADNRTVATLVPIAAESAGL